MNPSDDDKELAARIGDMMKISRKRGSVYSSFLNERQCALAEKFLRERHSENYRFFGGYESAQRRILCVYDNYFRPDDGDFPLSAVTFNYRKSYSLSHRDLLGAVMSLKLNRDAIGDIIIGEGISQVLVLDSVRNIVAGEIRKIGSVGVKVDDDCEILLSAEQNFREITGTVSSLRFDSVLSMALNLSRGKTVQIISSGSAEVNFFPVSDKTYKVKQGDVFSVRGFGKYRLEEISGVTKKGRIHITVLKYC